MSSTRARTIFLQKLKERENSYASSTATSRTTHVTTGGPPLQQSIEASFTSGAVVVASQEGGGGGGGNLAFLPLPKHQRRDRHGSPPSSPQISSSSSASPTRRGLPTTNVTPSPPLQPQQQQQHPSPPHRRPISFTSGRSQLREGPTLTEDGSTYYSTAEATRDSCGVVAASQEPYDREEVVEEEEGQPVTMTDGKPVPRISFFDVGDGEDAQPTPSSSSTTGIVPQQTAAATTLQAMVRIGGGNPSPLMLGATATAPTTGNSRSAELSPPLIARGARGEQLQLFRSTTNSQYALARQSSTASSANHPFQFLPSSDSNHQGGGGGGGVPLNSQRSGSSSIGSLVAAHVSFPPVAAMTTTSTGPSEMGGSRGGEAPPLTSAPFPPQRSASLSAAPMRVSASGFQREGSTTASTPPVVGGGSPQQQQQHHRRSVLGQSSSGRRTNNATNHSDSNFNGSVSDLLLKNLLMRDAMGSSESGGSLAGVEGGGSSQRTSKSTSKSLSVATSGAGNVAVSSGSQGEGGLEGAGVSSTGQEVADCLGAGSPKLLVHPFVPQRMTIQQQPSSPQVRMNQSNQLLPQPRFLPSNNSVVCDGSAVGFSQLLRDAAGEARMDENNSLRVQGVGGGASTCYSTREGPDTSYSLRVQGTRSVRDDSSDSSAFLPLGGNNNNNNNHEGDADEDDGRSPSTQSKRFSYQGAGRSVDSLSMLTTTSDRPLFMYGSFLPHPLYPNVSSSSPRPPLYAANGAGAPLRMMRASIANAPMAQPPPQSQLATVPSLGHVEERPSGSPPHTPITYPLHPSNVALSAQAAAAAGGGGVMPNHFFAPISETESDDCPFPLGLLRGTAGHHTTQAAQLSSSQPTYRPENSQTATFHSSHHGGEGDDDDDATEGPDGNLNSSSLHPDPGNASTSTAAGTSLSSVSRIKTDRTSTQPPSPTTPHGLPDRHHYPMTVAPLRAHPPLVVVGGSGVVVVPSHSAVVHVQPGGPPEEEQPPQEEEEEEVEGQAAQEEDTDVPVSLSSSPRPSSHHHYQSPRARGILMRSSTTEPSHLAADHSTTYTTTGTPLMNPTHETMTDVFAAAAETFGGPPTTTLCTRHPDVITATTTSAGSVSYDALLEDAVVPTQAAADKNKNGEDVPSFSRQKGNPLYVLTATRSVPEPLPPPKKNNKSNSNSSSSRSADDDSKNNNRNPKTAEEATTTTPTTTTTSSSSQQPPRPGLLPSTTPTASSTSTGTAQLASSSRSDGGSSRWTGSKEEHDEIVRVLRAVCGGDSGAKVRTVL